MRFETILATKVVTEVALLELSKDPDIQWDELPYFASLFVAMIFHPDNDLVELVHLPQEQLELLGRGTVIGALPTIKEFPKVSRLGSSEITEALHIVVERSVNEYLKLASATKGN